MNDPLTSIDAENLEKNVNDAFKTMHKSVKIFQDIPGKICAFVEVEMNLINQREIFNETSIDAENLEKNVNDAFKTMHKSVKIFQDIPGKICAFVEVEMNLINQREIFNETSIDAENLEKNVNDAFKTMHKSVKIFQDIPGKICAFVEVEMNLINQREIFNETSIDAENLEKNVNDAFKTMHKSVKIFQDIPGKICAFVEVEMNLINQREIFNETSIDAENLEKNVNDAFKTMHKSVKIFQDIPGKICAFVEVEMNLINQREIFNETSIDAENLEKNVNDAFKTMHKSVKIFQDIPGKICFFVEVEMNLINQKEIFNEDLTY